MDRERVRRRYARIELAVWRLPQVQRLTKPGPNATSLLVWLVGGPETRALPGVHVYGSAGLAEAIGWPADETLRVFEELAEAGLAAASWPERLVACWAALYQPESPNVAKSWGAQLATVPACRLRDEIARRILAVCGDDDGKRPGPFAQGFREGFLQGLPEGFAQGFVEPIAVAKAGTRAGLEQRSDDATKGIPGVETGTPNGRATGREAKPQGTSGARAPRGDGSPDPDGGARGGDDEPATDVERFERLADFMRERAIASGQRRDRDEIEWFNRKVNELHELAGVARAYGVTAKFVDDVVRWGWEDSYWSGRLVLGADVGRSWPRLVADFNQRANRKPSRRPANVTDASAWEREAAARRRG